MKKPRVLMIVEHFYPEDVRVRNEVSGLRDICDFTVFCLRKDKKALREDVDGVEVFRLPRFPDLKIGFLIYVLQYFYITFFAFLFFLVTHPVRRYKVIHLHNPPDTLFAVGLAGKILGAKMVYDLHDLSPELYLSRLNPNKGFLYRSLLLLERLSCRLADVVITVNETYRDLIIQRHGISETKVFVVRNNPKAEEYFRDGLPQKDQSGEVVNMVFVGEINPQDGLDILLDVIQILVKARGKTGLLCRVLGSGDSLPTVMEKAREEGIDEYVVFEGYVTDRQEVREAIQRADIGIEPAPDNPVNRLSTFIKVMEYMACGIPLVAFDLKETRRSAGSAAVLAAPGDKEAFADAVQDLMEDRAKRERLGRSGRERVLKDLNWDRASENLVAAYGRLGLRAAG